MTWRARAACRGADQSTFYPENPKQLAPARAICAACAVRDDCLRFVLALPAADDKCGVFAGTSARQRERLRRFGADLLEWDSKQQTYRPLVWNSRTHRWESQSRSRVA